jgi:hypothetical protein
MTMTSASHFRLNGERAALEAAWQLLCRNQGDMPFSEIVKFVRARVPRLSEERIRAEFARRLRRNPAAAPDCAVTTRGRCSPVSQSTRAPRAVRTPRAFSALATPRRLLTTLAATAMAASLRAAKACLRVFARRGPRRL